MQLQILKLIIWPKAEGLQPREINFKPNAINIISGESGTGKSALTSIIDYCLGGTKCTIPVGIIREYSLWYGLLLEMKDGKLLIARKDPGDKKSSEDMYWSEGKDVPVPTRPEKNISRNVMISHLNDQCGLRKDPDPEEYTYHSPYASFRDLSAFNFQPQHIIANPFTLFFKADTTEHREKLKSIFPLVLGIIDYETLQKQRREKHLKKELELIRQKLDLIEMRSNLVSEKLSSYLAKASYLGLLRPNEVSDLKHGADPLSIVKIIYDRILDLKHSYSYSSLSDEFNKDLAECREQESTLKLYIDDLSRQKIKLTEIAAISDSYQDDLKSQKERLTSVHWLRKKLSNHFKCPFCNAEHKRELPQVQSLYDLADEFADLSGHLAETSPLINDDIQKLGEQIDGYEKELKTIIEKRERLESLRTEKEELWQQNMNLYLFAGELKTAMETLKQSGESPERSKANSIEQELNEIDYSLGEQRDEKTRIMLKVSRLISYYAMKLELEYSQEPVKLNIQELTVEIGKDGYFLWEIGSGKNWVGYHIATLLALHEYFSSLQKNIVPPFLLLDQFSQAHFPQAVGETTTAVGEATTKPERPETQSEVLEVKRIFENIADFMSRVKHEFQVIITEHAGLDVWDGIPGVFSVGNWRHDEDEFLIPKSWLQSADI